MLYSQQDLNMNVCAGSFDILNESIYIDHNTISPNTVGVVINEDLNAGIVRFNDVESISEEYGCDYIDAMIAIAEANDIDPNQLAVAIDEAEIIENPTIIYELANVVINPISENSLAYIFCESMIDAYIETDDEDYLYGIVNEGLGDFIMKIHDKKEAFKNSTPISMLRHGPIDGYVKAQEHKRQHEQKEMVEKLKRGEIVTKEPDPPPPAKPGRLSKMKDSLFSKASAAGSAAKSKITGLYQSKFGKKDDTPPAVADVPAAAKVEDKMAEKQAAAPVSKSEPVKAEAPKEVTNIEKVAKEAEGKPKRWISRKIASLRKIYANYLQKAREAGPNAGTFKKIASKILGVIDMLLEKLENFTNNAFRK